MISYNAEQVSEKDLLIAAQEIFESSEKDFQKIKSEKWYQTFFHAITLNQDGKKYAVKGVRSLAKLQQLFMTVYVKNYRDTHSQLNETIEGIKKTQEAVKQLYHSCVLHFEEQASLSTLSSTDAEILALFLGEYRNSEGIVPENVQKYNCGVLTALHVNMPTGLLQQHQIAKLQKPEVVYRCFMEQCAVDGTIDTQEWTDQIYQDLDDLDLGPSRRRQIKESVKNEIEIAGIDYFFVKYSKEALDILDSDFEIAEDISASSAVKDENEADFEEKEIDTSIEREYLKISGIIPVTAKKVYENKDIHFSSAIIECSGELEFRNCTIHYNEDSASHIYLRNQASLMILSSTVICHGCWKESQSFIIAGTNAVCVMAGVCFLDCVDFISGNFEVFRFEKNICFDCCKNFLDISIHKQGEAKIDDNVFLFLCEPFFKPISSTEGTWPKGKCIDFHGSGKKLLSNCGVKCFSNQKSCYMDSIIFVDFRPSRYSENGNNDVCYCSFSNVKNCIHGGTQIYNCIFDHCQKVIYSCPAACSILNCQFVDCEHAICDMDQGGIIQNCQFSGSTKEGYISSNKGCPIKIISCEFANLSLAKENSLNNRGIILLGACSDKEISINGTTQISCCIFNGVKLTGWNTFSSYLITHSYFQPRVKQPIAYVSDCIFQNCVTDDLNGEIIKQKGTHYGRFNRVSHFPEISVYNCSGYDEVKDLNHSISPIALEMRETDSDGNKIGSGYVLNHSYEEYLEVKTSYLNQERT